MQLETLLAHAGAVIDPSSGGILAPIHTATTYLRAEDGSYPHGNVYGRTDNPTRRLFEQTLSALEGGTETAAFASGQAATLAVLQALPAGGHVLIPEDAYFGVGALLSQVFEAKGLAFSRVDQTDVVAVAGALRPETCLIWAETPSNPRCQITDLPALAQLAHQNEALLLVDNTWATPLLQRPFLFGADLVLHSVTKYLSGHSDVLGGAVTTKEKTPLFDQIRLLQGLGGAVMDPFSAWLALRGLRSLGARMRVHCENARALAAFLAQDPRIEKVHYPALPQDEGHVLAQKQMADFGGMLSILVKGGAAEAIQVAAKVKVFVRATSLGGTESLMEHRYSIEKPPTKTPPNLLRISVGLEAVTDLIADLDQALQTLV